VTILVTGGAGYIGSHMSHALCDAGYDVVVVDNLSTGDQKNVSQGAHFVRGNAGDEMLLGEIFKRWNVGAVVHFAGSIVVPDSVAHPLDYYSNNTVVSRNLISACLKAGISKFIFSSTAAVYGAGLDRPILESHPAVPVNPYGRSKLMTEWMLEDVAKAHDFRYVALRYFNVAGADFKGRTGQSTPFATHLIKRASQAALGQIPYLELFGTDYPTKDGTAVRDYIHVWDLINAHILAIEHLNSGGGCGVYNCGYGEGASVQEVIAAVERVSGKCLPTRHRPRRAGDAASLVANADRLRASLGWKPKHQGLDGIVKSALTWERGLQNRLGSDRAGDVFADSVS
jgi:UDP-glucose 4-epimerase